MIRCSNCKQSYPEEAVPYRCSKCGGLFEFDPFPPLTPGLVDDALPGIWKYRHTFGLSPEAPLITLGEGDTPLIWAEAFGRRMAFKLEYQNPSGSHKDRGVAVLCSFLRSRGVTTAVEDSSGNAGASFAAYAARAGITARIFIPDSTSGPKRAQIEACGAEVVRIIGPRSETSDAVLRAADRGAVYASHAYLPQLLPGYATIAYELLSQVGQVPGTVIAPVGQGGLLLGIGLGFENLLQAGAIPHLPRLVGVQALACAPLWAVFTQGRSGLAWVTERETLAEGVRTRHPLRGDALLSMVGDSRGTFIAVEEEAILPGRDELASRGLYVEPTSAIVWSALSQTVEDFPDPMVVILTGSGYKYS